MTIKEIQDKKAKLENEINRLMSEFMEDTGVKVSGVSLSLEEIRSINGEVSFIVEKVDLEVKL